MTLIIPTTLRQALFKTDQGSGRGKTILKTRPPLTDVPTGQPATGKTVIVFCFCFCDTSLPAMSFPLQLVLLSQTNPAKKVYIKRYKGTLPCTLSDL